MMAATPVPVNKSRVVWIQPPSKMAQALDRYGDRVQIAIVAVAEFIGQQMANEAKRNARWIDRTGNARSGLFYQVVNEAAEKVVIVYLAHTVFYGVFLELAHAERYAIIWPTIEKHLPELKRLLDQIFR